MLPPLVVLWLHAVLVELTGLAIGAMLFPIAYEILGVYHRDSMVHYPPSSYNRTTDVEHDSGRPQYFLGYDDHHPVAGLVAACRSLPAAARAHAARVSGADGRAARRAP
jgi:hypothetical protein